jgi:uncharacterized membrane protein
MKKFPLIPKSAYHMKLPEKDILYTLGTITFLNILILFVRNRIESNAEYNFLLWNLFLGFLPFAFAYLLLVFNSIYQNNLLLYVMSLVWLLFYPNAPYMITDFIHIQAESTTVIYDTLVIFSIAILSLFYGFFSLKIIHQIWKTRFSAKIATFAIIAALLLSSLGIYLGRILRLNSWDFFLHPLHTVESTLNHMWPVSENATTYYIVFLFTFIQGAMLVMIRYLNFDRYGAYQK